LLDPVSVAIAPNEQETVKYEVTLTPTLDAARKQLFGIAEDLARRQIDMGLKEIDPKEYVKELVHDGMMEACYEWARGVPFVSITKLTGNITLRPRCMTSAATSSIMLLSLCIISA
jgi:superfamily II RNA helicase